MIYNGIDFRRIPTGLLSKTSGSMPAGGLNTSLPVIEDGLHVNQSRNLGFKIYQTKDSALEATS